jgi:hypothetical protein
MTDAEAIENLRASAAVKRRLRALGHVTILIGDEPKPSPWMPDDLRALYRRVWPQLSAEDQATLSEWKEAHGI